MSSKPGKLGVDFWGNFYRVDKQDYTEDKLREEVAKCGLQTQLESGGVTLWRLHGCMPRGVVGRAAEDGRTAAVETLY